MSVLILNSGCSKASLTDACGSVVKPHYYLKPIFHQPIIDYLHNL